MKGWIAVVFVVSWANGVNWQRVDCRGKEPEGIICAKPVENRAEKVFNEKKAALEFKAVMEDMKATGVKMEERKK